jgi:GrpB-like predicted nucleotidyltransferase (UPF0157 family)
VGVSTVDLVDYSETWPDAFETERDLLSEVLGETALVIEHIGSTSVPGLLAKPTIDIAVGVRSIAEVLDHQAALENLGYEFRGGFHDDHRMVRKVVGGERTHHLHFRVYPSAEFDEWLEFRNLLRRDPVALQRYASVKTELAQRFYSDRGGYVDAKTQVVEELLNRARSSPLPSVESPPS